MSATDTSSGKRKSSQCCCFRRNNNEPEDFGDINTSPWRPTLEHACFLTFWSLVVPFFFNLLFMVGQVWEDLQDHVEGQSVHNLHNVTQAASKVRVKPTLFQFPGPGLLVSSVVAFFYFCTFVLYPDSKWLKAVAEVLRDLSQVLRCPQRVSGEEECIVILARSSPLPAPTIRRGHSTARSQAPRSRQWKTAFYVLGSAFFAAVLPWVAWGGPLLWWRDAAAQFRTCHLVCRYNQPVNMEAYAEVCVKHMKVHPVYPSEDMNLNTSLVGERDARLCMEIMNNTATSKYTDHVLGFGHTFLAFESNLRQHYLISCVDIFGGLLELGLFILVLSARAALWEQFRTLRRLRVQFIKNHMLKNFEKVDMLEGENKQLKIVEEWIKFFDMLGQGDGTWTHDILKKVAAVRRKGEAPEKQEQDIEDILKNTEDNSLNGVNDCMFTSWAFFCAAVDAFIPILSRFFFSSRHPVVEHFHLISWTSAIVTFVGAFSSFFLLSSAFVRNKSQIKAVMAFDWMFRLPLAQPQSPVSLPLAHPQPTGVREFTEGRWFRSLTTFDEMNNKEELNEFAFFFFYGRRYLQLDKVDERHSLEAAMVVAFLGLFPRLCILVCNLILEEGQRRTVQPVNAACLWRLGFVFVISVFSLLQSMRLNEHFGKHRERLESLVPHSEYLYGLHRQRPAQPAAAAGAAVAQPPDPQNRVAELVPALIAVMDSHELPSTLFGLKVQRKMLVTFMGVCGSISLPELVNFFSALIEHLANVV